MKARHEFNSQKEYQEYLKTYFAAMAMQGVMAGVNSSKEAWTDYINTANKKGISIDELIAKNSIDAADALINELNKPTI